MTLNDRDTLLRHHINSTQKLIGVKASPNGIAAQLRLCFDALDEIAAPFQTAGKNAPLLGGITVSTAVINKRLDELETALSKGENPSPSIGCVYACLKDAAMIYAARFPDECGVGND